MQKRAKKTNGQKARDPVAGKAPISKIGRVIAALADATGGLHATA